MSGDQVAVIIGLAVVVVVLVTLSKTMWARSLPLQSWRSVAVTHRVHSLHL